MANPAPGYAEKPEHRVDLVPETRQVRVSFGGAVIADSRAALRVEETGHGPVHYVPEKDVRMDLLQPTANKTYCPFKGDCSYWTIAVDGGAKQHVSLAGSTVLELALRLFSDDERCRGIALALSPAALADTALRRRFAVAAFRPRIDRAYGKRRGKPRCGAFNGVRDGKNEAELVRGRSIRARVRREHRSRNGAGGRAARIA
jgi:uncharacterized protein (DUF427 family)